MKPRAPSARKLVTVAADRGLDPGELLDIIGVRYINGRLPLYVRLSHAAINAPGPGPAYWNGSAMLDLINRGIASGRLKFTSIKTITLTSREGAELGLLDDQKPPFPEFA